MIPAISTYAKSIILFMIFISLVNLLIPGEKYRAGINIVLGLLLVFIISGPVLRLVSGDRDWLNGVLSSVTDSVAGAQNQAAAEKVDQDQILQRQQTLITQALNQQAEAEAERAAQNCGAALVSVNVYYDADKQIIRGMDVTVSARNRQQLDKIKNDISYFYNLSPENINVKNTDDTIS